MKWILLALACVALAFVPWRAVFKHFKPYALRVAIGLSIAAAVIVLTYNLGPLKLL